MDTQILPASQSKPGEVAFFFSLFLCLSGFDTVFHQPTQLRQCFLDLGDSPRTVDELPSSGKELWTSVRVETHNRTLNYLLVRDNQGEK